jgi:hypothetical protein
MTKAILSNAFKTNRLDLLFPAAGAIGRVILLKGDLALGLGLTANATTDELTTATAHGLVSGSRVRIASSGTIPAPLAATVDYFAIVTGASTLKLATTLANATANTSINLTDAGSGVLTLNEQTLTAADSVAVLINKELNGAGYARLAIDNLGAATIIGVNGEKPPKVLSFTNSGAANLDYRHYLIAFGASGVVGDVAGVTDAVLVSEVSTVTTIPGQQRNITLNLRLGAKI